MSAARALLVGLSLCAGGADSARAVERDLDMALLVGNASINASQNQPQSGFKCGAIVSSSDLCWPKATTQWHGRKEGACTKQCQYGWASCVCPVDGESCVSVASSNPGLKYIVVGSVAKYLAVKVNAQTKEWFILKTKVRWEGNKKVIKFEWAAPSEEGKSHVESLEEVITPNYPGDFCDPGVAAKYADELAKKGGLNSPWW